MDNEMEHESGIDSPVMTLGEALEEYEEMEKVSNAVLGASDPRNCSYEKGYMKRQALYACMTCNPKKFSGFQPAGVCLACSYKCHDGHELVELYTKRNFRCDCGNKKFTDNPCKLQQEKDEVNDKNLYSQNFSGIYCTCHRPYPDPEYSSEEPDIMSQCIACEDWYHTKHAIPGIIWGDYDHSDQSFELLCSDCTHKLKFLEYYGSFQAKSVSLRSDAQEATDEVTVTSETELTKISGDDESASGCDSQDSGVILNETNLKTKDQASPVLQIENCLLKSYIRIPNKPECGTLWVEGWRKKLCRCATCKEMYESLSVAFLMDDEDTIEAYEAIGIAKSESEMIQAEESFNQKVNEMGRVGQIELISGYNDMKEALKDFLKEFADNGKVVQPKDITDFFENLRASKRPRLDPGSRY